MLGAGAVSLVDSSLVGSWPIKNSATKTCDDPEIPPDHRVICPHAGELQVIDMDARHCGADHWAQVNRFGAAKNSAGSAAPPPVYL
jgi:hypothetical protein